jgi:rhodanese-related sulfurtransferase
MNKKLTTVAQIAEFDAIIDVRSPSEFAEDHLPGAQNCPVLSDEERARVGTLYKQVSSFEAKKIGAVLVGRNIASMLETHFLDKPRQWRPLIVCWRGGQRSGAFSHVMREVGWDSHQLAGGYKAWRRQVRTDARRGLKTGMFVSGYRGSPVGMLDANFIKQQKLLMQHNIQFVDGLNEDLAATAVWGTQMLHTVGKQKFDGVTGTWYGKAPGVDRSATRSSTPTTPASARTAACSPSRRRPELQELVLAAASPKPMLYHVGIPSLYPANVQDILDFGLHGYYLSRMSGLWAGMKIVTNVADGSGTANRRPPSA